jgi:hypothetical protein
MSNATAPGEFSVSGPREWFDAACFEGENATLYGLEKFIIVGTCPRRQIVLNPQFPDTIEVLQNGKPASNLYYRS